MPEPELIQAAIGIEGIIWLIVIVIWIVGQVLSKSGRTGRRPPPTPSIPGEPNPMEEELRELFETITGQKSESEPAPVKPPPVPRRQARGKTASAGRGRAILAEIIAPPVPQIEAGHVTPASLSSGHTGINLRAMTLPAHLLNIPAMQFGLSSSVSRNADPLIMPVVMQNKNTVRQLMLGRIIFGPPRALDPFPQEGPARN